MVCGGEEGEVSALTGQCEYRRGKLGERVTCLELTQTLTSSISTGASAAPRAAASPVCSAAKSDCAARSAFEMVTFALGQCRCSTGLAPKNVCGVCSWCCSSSVKSSAFGALLKTS